MTRERFATIKHRLRPVPPEDVERFKAMVRERVIEPIKRRARSQEKRT